MSKAGPSTLRSWRDVPRVRHQGGDGGPRTAVHAHAAHATRRPCHRRRRLRPGLSATRVSVVSTRPAMEPAFWRALG